VESLFKILLSVVTFIACVYSSRVFGLGVWSIAFIAFSFVLVLSIFMPMLTQVARLIAKFMSVMATLAFVLLMLAATVGGSFSMSESNEFFAFGLVLIALLGSGFFFIKDSDENSTVQAREKE